MMHLPTYIRGVQQIAAKEYKAYVDAHTDRTDDVPTEIPEPSAHARKYEENLLEVLVALDYAYDNVDEHADEDVDYGEASKALKEGTQASFRACMFARQAAYMKEEADVMYLVHRCIDYAQDFIEHGHPGVTMR
jgi:hypothetical protein